MKFFKPFFVISKATAHGLSLIFWIIRLAMLGGVIFIIVAITTYSCQPGKPPPAAEAPYAVVAVTADLQSTHVYYAKQVLERGAVYILLDYWRFDGKEYNYNEGEKSLVKKDWGKIGIYRRQ
jgi:hypothetical protein